jgi:hypothetical protein
MMSAALEDTHATASSSAAAHLASSPLNRWFVRSSAARPTAIAIGEVLVGIAKVDGILVVRSAHVLTSMD